MGFSCAASLPNYILPYIIMKKIASYIFKESSFTSVRNHIQSRYGYGITFYDSSTQKNIDLVQRLQKSAARLIYGDFDYINSRGIDLVVYNPQKEGLFSFHVNVRSHSWNRSELPFGLNWYALWYPWLWHKRSWFNERLPSNCVQRDIQKSVSYLGGKLWNDLPDFVKNSTNMEIFKVNYRIYKGLTWHASLHIYNIIDLI